MAYCPECGAEVETGPDDFEEGDVIECDECGVELEVASVSPLELETIDGDWDEDEDEDWD